MNRKFLILFLVSILLSYRVFAGNTPGNPVIENLLLDQRPVSFVSWPRENYLPNIDAPFITYPQNLIKTSSGLFLFINGSGRLYHVTTSDMGINFERVDSTNNFGYNIGSFGFSYNNRIYSLGGYGYWRMNGQLRVFNEKAKQWDIIKLNKEIPILTGKTEGILWYDVKDKKIYTAYYLVRDEAIKTKELDETQFIYDVMMLDLNNTEWIRLGSLNSFLKGKLQIIKPIAMSPWGQLITIGDKISLLDFRSNKILTLDIRKEQYQSLIREGWGSSFYFKDSTLFYGNNNSLDSVLIRYSDFNSISQQLYSKEDISFFINKSVIYFFYTIPVVLIGIILLFYRRNKSKNDKNVESGLALISGINLTQSVFDEMETKFLELLIHNTSTGTTTSTDEQNRVLGLVKKNVEIQKKQRSDIIIRINKKYSFVTQSKNPIIKKNRSEFDKRSYEYFIDYSRVEEIIRFLKMNKML